MVLMLIRIVVFLVYVLGLSWALVANADESKTSTLRVSAFVVGPEKFDIAPVVSGNISVKPYRTSNGEIGAHITGTEGEVQF